MGLRKIAEGLVKGPKRAIFFTQSCRDDAERAGEKFWQPEIANVANYWTVTHTVQTEKKVERERGGGEREGKKGKECCVRAAQSDDKRATRKKTMIRTWLCTHIHEMYRDVHGDINWQKRFIETVDVFGEFVYFSVIKEQYIVYSDICSMHQEINIKFLNIESAHYRLAH